MENETPGLEALNEIKYTLQEVFDYSPTKQLDTIEKALKEGAKNKNKAEAFDIIVRKNVDATRVRLHKDVESYNQRTTISQNKLTEEEFDKVREVIING